MIMLADLHLGLGEDNSLWHKSSLILAAEIHDIAVKHNIDTICVLGDIFDNRKQISQKTHDLAIEIMTGIWKDFRVILVRGNHDTYYKERPVPNWLKMFKDSENVITVETEPCVYKDYCFVPWDYDISTLDWKGILLGHFEIGGFKMNNYYECNSSILTPRSFDRFKQVFSGHFHFPQSYGNIHYIGSPFQHNFGDVGSKRGYYILDEEETLRFYEFTKSPQFVILRTNETITSEQVKGNMVKIVFDKDYGTRRNNNLIEDVEMMEPAALVGVDTSSFTIDDSVLNGMNSDDVVIKDNETLLKDYIGVLDFPDHLKKKTMLTMINMLIREVSSED